jgi:CubicO group peptidase (beta-lactamase class C family)
MLLDGGRAGSKRPLSNKSIELMTQDQLGKIDSSRGFGLGFGINGVKEPVKELGSPGEYGWDGFFYPAFSLDPKEQMIVISMAQLHPSGGLNLDRKIQVLAHRAMVD